MFDFIFKRRRADGFSSTLSNTQDTQQATAQAAVARAQIRRDERGQALRQAAALSDEQSALAFIVQCEFADARLEAAEWLQSLSALTEALRVVRNSDRRVAKLLQTRLDALQRRQHAQQQMQAVIEQANILLRDPGLTPDRAAEADRAWTAAGGEADQTVDPALAAHFASIHEALNSRLSQQAQLQRSLIDTRTHLQQLQEALQQAAAAGAADSELGALAETLDRIQRQIAQDCDAPEAAAMPKQLLPDCEHLLQACRVAHERVSADLLMRRQPAAEVAEAPIRMEPVDNPDKPDKSPKSAKTPKRAASASLSDLEQMSQWLDLLAQLESALEQGALQAAGEAERTLRDIDVRVLKPAAEAMSRMTAAYASLRHLQGWARWGGNISREELLQAALALPEQALPTPELMQKIGGLRARWKLLSASAGQAPQALWERFDAACTTAYAPARAQFERQDREREENRAAADALIAEVVLFAEQHGPALSALEAGEDISVSSDAQLDWKKLAQFDARMHQAWQRLGPLGHKEKRVLERAFNAALKAVRAPLQNRRKIEIGAREALIAEVIGLQADDRQALDTLRRIQADWQQCAQAVPLAHKDEQRLWLAFRAACDDVFAQRKEAAVTQDAQRQAHLLQKQALCEQLEQAIPGGDKQVSDAADLRDLLQQIQTAWLRIGQVPRAAERLIEQRFRDAAGALQRSAQAIQEQAAAAAIDAEAALIDERLTLCFALDVSLAEGRTTVSDAEAWRSRWQAGARLPDAFEQVLTQRFEKAVAAIGDDCSGYLQHVQQQREVFDDILLETEIAAGLDSPPEYARRRMQLQVTLLQSSLKAGAATLSGRQHLLRLCALPVLADRSALERIDKVVRYALRH